MQKMRERKREMKERSLKPKTRGERPPLEKARKDIDRREFSVLQIRSRPKLLSENAERSGGA
jgi:hypothetical protein